MRVLPGPSALTAFEAERVVQKLRANYPAEAGNVVAVESSYLYLLLIRKGIHVLLRSRPGGEKGELLRASQHLRLGI